MIKKFILLFLFLNNLVLSQEIFTLRSPEGQFDTRYNFDNELIELALKATVDEFGPYKIQYSQHMNFSRAIKIASVNQLQNFFFKNSYEESLEKSGLTPVYFPVDLGIVGKRVCFVNPKIKDEFLKVKTLSQLSLYVHGQGQDWSDVKILRYNNLKVQEYPTYESLFSAVAIGRVDLFCRGANEIKSEFEKYSTVVKDLMMDSHIVINYNLPRFFYTHKNNVRAKKRIEKGLRIIFENGEYEKLWQKEYRASVEFSNLSKRLFINLENPLTKDLKFDYLKYFKKY